MLPPDSQDSTKSLRHSFLSRAWVDIIIFCVLFVAGTALVWRTSHRLSVGLRSLSADDVWFESDVGRVFYNMSARHSDQYRSQVHPIFALIANPVCVIFHKVFRLDLNGSADLFLALTAGVWMVLMFVVIRRLGFDRGMAAMSAVIGLFSTSGLLFFAVPESYGLSSVSILLAIWLLVFTNGTRRSTAGAVLASAASLSMTVTNWSLGLLLTLRRYWFRRWLQISINAFFVVTVLWSLERAVMPSAQFFTAVAGERQYVHFVTPSVVAHTAVVFASHTIVCPAVQQVTSFGADEDPIGPAWKTGLSMQSAPPGSGSILGVVLAVAWLVIFGFGVVTLARESANPLALPILGFLLLQFLLHVLYGEETLLYSLSWMPVLIIVAAYAFQRMGRLRWPAIAFFAVLLAVNNYGQFRHVSTLVDSYQAAHPLAPPESPEEMIPKP